MKLRTFGSTAHQVSPVGLGLAALGRPGYINLGHAEDLELGYDVETLQRRTHALLDLAWSEGIRYIDAARSYGRAEAFLGAWLHARAPAPAEIMVGSKWGYTYTAGWQVEADQHEVKEHSRTKLEEQWTQSRALLGDHLHLYQIHSATLQTGVLRDAEVLERLAEIKAGGTAVGLTLSGPEQAHTLGRALRVEVGGTRLFDAVQATWNLLEPAAGTMLALAHREGLGVIVKEALANGRLTRRNHAPSFYPKLERLTQQAERLHTTVEALAFAAALRQPWADVVLSGAAREEHLRDNLSAVQVVWDEEAAGALAGLAEPSEVYWRTRSELSWS